MRIPRATRPENARPREHNLSRGYLALLATVAIWSMPSLFQYYLNRYYDPWAQNFYRYSVACLAIAPFVYYQVRRGAPTIDMRAIGICLIPCVPNVIHQVTQVIALFYMGPGVYAIFIRSSVIFTALLALIFFPEERHIIRQWQFQAGTLLGLIGAFGVTWFQGGVHDAHIALPGLAIAFTASLSWALYSTLIKRPSAQLGSIRSFGIISVITSALLLPLTCLFGKIDTPLHVGGHVNLDPYHFRHDLHHHCARSLLRRDSGNRRRPLANISTPLSAWRACSVRLDFWGTSWDSTALECWDSARGRISRHASQTDRDH